MCYARLQVYGNAGLIELAAVPSVRAETSRRDDSANYFSQHKAPQIGAPFNAGLLFLTRGIVFDKICAAETGRRLFETYHADF